MIPNARISKALSPILIWVENSINAVRFAANYLLKYMSWFKRKPFPTARQARQLMARPNTELDNALKNIQLRATIGNNDTLIKHTGNQKLVAQLRKLGYNVSDKQVLSGYLAVSW